MTFENSIIVETSSGLGLEIFVPFGSPLFRYGEGEEIMVYTSMAVKEDGISLYGFHNRETLELFELLITVSGIGAKGAMLKQIGALARTDIEALLGNRVYLDLWVKVKKDWRDREGVLRNFGFGQEK